MGLIEKAIIAQPPHFLQDLHNDLHPAIQQLNELKEFYEEVKSEYETARRAGLLKRQPEDT